MDSAGLDNAEAVAWLCFILGAIVLLVGLYLGVKTAPEKVKEKNEKKLEEARASLEESSSLLQAAESRNLEGGDAAGVAAAATKVEEAKSALEQVGSIIGSLPEHQRFPGMLILVGAVLMSVGTIQFGGTAIF